MRKSIITFLAVILVVTAFLGNHRNTLSLSSTIRLKAEFDAYVSENNPDSCYGREVVLNVRSYSKDGGHSNHRTYIMFDVSSLFKNNQIVSASLWLYKNPEGANSGIRNVQAFRVTGAWDEITLDWNNQPSFSSKLTDSTRVVGPMEWYSWDLTRDVIAWHKGLEINHGTMLKDEFENSATDYASVFLSREASHPENPYLEIKYTESPLETITSMPDHATDSQIMKDLVTYATVVSIVIIIVFASLRWIMLRRKKTGKGHCSGSKTQSLHPLTSIKHMMACTKPFET